MRARVFWNILTLEARKRMSYRADFWINAVVGLGAHLAVSYFLAFAIFRESGQEQVGGYTLRGMLLYLVVATLLSRIVRSNDMEHDIAQDIYEGGLTRYLIYPTEYAAFKYAQQLGGLLPTVLQILLIGIWIPIAIGLPDESRITLLSVAMCLGALLVANLLHFLLTFPIQSVAFWADNVWSLMVAHRILAGLLGGLMVPLSLFPVWAQRILASLPFPYLFAFPVNVLFGRVSPLEWAQGMGIALGWCLVAALVGRLVWRRGDLQYTGVGI